MKSPRNFQLKISLSYMVLTLSVLYICHLTMQFLNVNNRLKTPLFS